MGLLEMTYIPNLTGVTQGNNPTTEVLASNGNQALNVNIADPRSVFNEIMVAQPSPIAQIDFIYGINGTVTTSNITGSNASVTTSLGLLNITSNGTSGVSSSILLAKKFVKYRAGQGSQSRMTALFSQPAQMNGSITLSGMGFAVANTTYLVDFIGFGYGNTVNCSQFGILWRRAGNDTFFPQTSWNQDTVTGGTKSGMILNQQALNTWQIEFQYCGNVFFYLENPYTGRFILVHTIPSPLIVTTIPNFQNPTMQLLWYSNSAATSSNTLTCYGASAGHFIQGQRELTGPRGALSYSPSANLALNVETMIFAIKNATYYGTNAQNSIPNRSQIHLRGFSVSSSGAFSFPGQGSSTGYSSPAPATITFRQLRNPVGAPTSWNAYNGTDNVSSTSTGTCSNIIGQSSVSTNVSQLTGLTTTPGFTITVACGSSQFIDFKQFEAVAYPGDILCFTANVNSQFSTSNVNVSAALTWNEDL
jgi:hypothetical protein